MARVFLSYDRDDVGVVRSIASTLGRAGHSVWWDQHIRGGAQYSKEIEEALKSADVVVVLWSRKSVESAWVRDEAAAGRDRGCLIPASLDRTEPPLGFRQYQTVDLSPPRLGGRKAGVRELLRAVEAAETARTAPPAVEAPRPPLISRFMWRAMAAVLLLALLVASAFLAWRGIEPGTGTPTVMVVSSDQNPASKDLARSLFVKLGQLQTADVDSIQLVQQAAGIQPDFTVQVSVPNDHGQASAAIALIGRDRALVWSKDFERSAGQWSDLREEMGFTTARVLGCAREAFSSTNKLDEETLKLFLGGCADYAELTGTDVGAVRRVIPAFEQVINRSPRFKGGWARLLLAESEVASNSPPSERKSIEDSLRKHLAAGRKVDATMPEALQAEILLVPARQFTRRMELVNRAVALHPDNAALLTLRSGMLMAVGRMNDAVQDAKHAAEIDVVSPSAEAAYIYALAHSGQTELAKHELRKAQTISPGAASLNEVQFSINLRYGDPAAALQELRTGSFRTQINPASQESFLRARLDPTHENVAHAISDASAVKQQTIRRLIQVLAEFGREQQILDELLKYDANTPEQFTDILFRPKGRALRQDPRFMLVAQRFGLLDYWQRSGKWPDFCSDPDLPYDCKKEAAKIQA